MLRTSDLNYELPEDRIATHPVSPRDAAKLLVVSRSDPARLEHRVFSELPEILHPAGAAGSRDLLVVNSSRVVPARFFGHRVDSHGRTEGLYLGPANSPTTEIRWNCLLKMRRQKPGCIVSLHDHAGKDSGVLLRLLERASEDGADGAGWVVRVEQADGTPVKPPFSPIDLLQRVGFTPVPPYIVAARKRAHEDVSDEQDRTEYQTVYASDRIQGQTGSVAAPTAGLHFTPELLRRLRSIGIDEADVTLNVGMGTFKPIETEFVEEHPMHSEWCTVPTATAHAIQRVRERTNDGKPCRVIAVGTTTARTLESFDSVEEMLQVQAKSTRLLITPGYRFKHVDALITNFHLPGTTLLAMVAALLETTPGAGVPRLLAIYQEAIRRNYRFYSFGDAVLILP